jgi:predicted DNA-binding transcriptional regulator AlpA
MMRLPDVLAMIAMGRSFWLDAVKAGQAPPPYKMGTASLWKKSEVQEWLTARLDGSSFTPARRQSHGNSLSGSSLPALERIATAVLAALVMRNNGNVSPGEQGQLYAEVACDFAESLLRQLKQRAT